MAYSWERLTEEEKGAILASHRGSARAPAAEASSRSPGRTAATSTASSARPSEIRAGNFELSGERLEKLFDEMRDLGVRGVRLMGGGEPLFRKDAAALIAAIGSRGLRITDVTTNGVLLTEPVVRALYAAGCDEICVSLNAGDARSYAAMMQTTGKNFDRVVENVRRGGAIKRETGSPTTLRVQFLVYKDNFRQLPEMYRLFRETGADRFWLNGLYPVRPMPTMTEADVAEMLLAYEEVLAQDYFERLERFSFWENVDRRAHRGLDRARCSQRAPLARRARVKLRQLCRRGRTAGARGRRPPRVLPRRLVLDDAQRQRRRGDLLHPPGPPDRGPRQHPPFEPRGDLVRRAVRALPRRACRDHGAPRRGRRRFEHGCAVEGVCAEKGACPTRSYYWSDDAAFRRRFHELVEAMPRPEGAPFAKVAPVSPSARLPVHTGVYK